MNTITVPKNEYDSLIKSNKEMGKRIRTIEILVNDMAQDEITSKYHAKLNKISKSTDKKSGKVFRNLSQIKKFFKNL